MTVSNQHISSPLIGGVVYVVVWGLFYFLLFPVQSLPYPPEIISWLYATIVVGIFMVTHRLSRGILQQVPQSLDWLFRSFFYLAGFLYAILLIALFHFLVILPPSDLLQELVSRTVAVLATILTSLAEGKRSGILTTEWVMRELAPVMAVVAMGILLAVFLAMLLSYVEMLHKNRQLQEARLRLLQSQMEPHFLFNALNTIAAEITQRPRQAENLVIALADFYRTTFQLTGKEQVPLDQEIALAQRYLEIQQARFGERLAVQFHVATECRTVPVPPFIVQPLVENAIQHGWCRREQPFRIEVSCKKEEQSIKIAVADTGCGFRKPLAQILKENHSLANIHQRLRMHYGKNAGITIEQNNQQGSVVWLTIPAHR